jgi:hypothetical protein
MSHKNGDRARFDRQRKARMHNRTRIRELRKTLPSGEGAAASKPTAVGNPVKKDGVL